MSLEERARRLLHRVCHDLTGPVRLSYLRNEWWQVTCQVCGATLPADTGFAAPVLTRLHRERLAYRVALKAIVSEGHNGREGAQVKRMKAIAREALEAQR